MADSGLLHLTICFLPDGTLSFHPEGTDREALANRLGALVLVLYEYPELLQHVAGLCDLEASH